MVSAFDAANARCHRGALVSVVDRASKFTFIVPVARKTADVVGAALVACLGPVAPLVHTLTADNGKEFACHRTVAEALSAQVCFARPYHSWERGLNERTNGLIRQYFPKPADFRTVDPEKVREVQDSISGRPRRAQGFRTPAEVFCQALNGMARLPG